MRSLFESGSIRVFGRVGALVLFPTLLVVQTGCSEDDKDNNGSGGANSNTGTQKTRGSTAGGNGTAGGNSTAIDYPYVDENTQTKCDRTVPESVLPAIDCVAPAPGTDGYSGCVPNTPCGTVTGCVLERFDKPESTIIETTYTGPDKEFVAPTTLLPSMGKEMTGRATGWFTRDDGTQNVGSCSLPIVRNLTGVALATVSFGDADWCGACAEVVGTTGRRVRVQIVDQCAGCATHSLDIPSGVDTPLNYLMDQDFASYKCPNYDGSLPISWHIVPCETEGGLRVSYLEGYNKWTPAIRLINHRLPIARLEEKVEGEWTTIPRTADNKYELTTRDNDTTIPVSIRVIAMDGSTITGEFPTFVENKLYEARHQF